MAKNIIPQELLPWIGAKKEYRLSQKHIQMARELGMNPKGFGKLANHKQQLWKAPLPEFIEHLYFKRFKKETPDIVLSFEQINKNMIKKKAEAKAKKDLRRAIAKKPFTDNTTNNNSPDSFCHEKRNFL